MMVRKEAQRIDKNSEQQDGPFIGLLLGLNEIFISCMPDTDLTYIKMLLIVIIHFT